MAATWRSSVPQQPPTSVRAAAHPVLRELDPAVLVQLSGGVELRVATRRPVRAEPDDTRTPVAALGQPGRDMAGMDTVTMNHSGAASASTAVIAAGSRVPSGSRPLTSTVDDTATGSPAGPGDADDPDRSAPAGARRPPANP